MTDSTETFSPELLVLARESRRLTQAGLAKAVGIAQGTISKLEHGLGSPAPELLSSLATALEYAPSLFFEASFTPRELPVVFHRKRKSLPVTDLRAIRATVEISRLQIRKLIRSVDIPENRIPAVDIERDDQRPGDIAREIRAHWGIPRGPIENLTGVLESAGVVVVLCDFGSRLIDGLSWFDPRDPMPPLIFLNSRSPGERARFTAAHELAHLALHYHKPLPPDSCEEEADEFAAEFLMPAADIRGFLGGVTLDALMSLKGRWRVSMGALLVQAHRLGKISPHKYKMLQIRMSSLGYRTREPIELPIEQPSVLRDIVNVHLDDLNYSDEALADAVHLPLSAFKAVFKGEKPGLRLVPSG